MKDDSYKAQSIQVLKNLEAVKKRPAMYVGDTNIRGLHHIVYEAIDNSIDECLAGYCNSIIVTIHNDGSVSVNDNGRGIPVDIHPEEKRPAVELVLTVLHAGGKFDDKTYKIAGGLHGVGISVTNALSSWLEVKVRRDNKIHYQKFIEGKPVTELKIIGEANDTGTYIRFLPNAKIFETITFDYDILSKRLRELAFLNAGVKIDLIDEITNKQQTFHYEGGLKSFVHFLNKNKSLLFNDPIYFKKVDGKLQIEIALQYNDSYIETIYSFCNGINTVEGGTHLTGFFLALTRSINDYIKKSNHKNGKEQFKLSGQDVREGLTAIVSIKIPNPQFEGQTKTKLGNLNLRGLVDSTVYDNLTTIFEENPAIAKSILNKCLLSYKAREAARKARDLTRRKSVLESGSLPGKLADCQERDPLKAELFIVEGDSAAGTGISARDRKYQAILPIRGKILNVEKARIDQIFKNNEITNLITAIGTSVQEEFDITKLRYHKIIILTDADSVTGDTPLLLFNKNNELEFQYIGDFVDNCIKPSEFSISSFSINPGEHKIKKISNIVKHPLKTSLYKIKTNLGYNVTITPYHSIFTYSNKKVTVKSGKDITTKDYVLIPKKLPRVDKDIIIDLINNIDKKNVYGSIDKEKLNSIHNEAYIELSLKQWKMLKEIRMKRGITRKKMGKFLGIFYLVLEQWEFKHDNVMPQYKLFKKYLKIIGINENRLKFKVHIPLNRLKQDILCDNYYLRNLNTPVKLKIHLDKNLCYLLGWYIGDGSSAKGKKNPYRYCISLGHDKKYYSNKLINAIKKTLGVNVIKEEKNNNKIIYFNSYNFDVLLKSLGLYKKCAYEKFVPDVIFNLNKNLQIAFLKGLLQSDGFVFVGKARGIDSKPICGHCTVSKRLMEGIVFIYRQLGILPAIVKQRPRDHFYNGKLIKSNYDKYDVLIGSIKQLKKARSIWKDHKNAKILANYIKAINTKIIRKRDRRFIIDVNKDFQGVKVLNIEKVKSNDKFVYDISVDINRSFIGGLGGLTLHNSDGNHISTLLLTLFYRYTKPLIENGNLYIAQPPLYKLIKNKKTYYIRDDKKLSELLKNIGEENPVIQRFKGLGEMDSHELAETVMSKDTRTLKRVTIQDAVEAEEMFRTLMGEEVVPRRDFIMKHAKSVKNLDI